MAWQEPLRVCLKEFGLSPEGFGEATEGLKQGRDLLELA